MILELFESQLKESKSHLEVQVAAHVDALEALRERRQLVMVEVPEAICSDLNSYEKD